MVDVVIVFLLLLMAGRPTFLSRCSSLAEFTMVQPFDHPSSRIWHSFCLTFCFGVQISIKPHESMRKLSYHKHEWNVPQIATLVSFYRRFYEIQLDDLAWISSILLNKSCSLDQKYFRTFQCPVSKVNFWYCFEVSKNFSIKSSPTFPIDAYWKMGKNVRLLGTVMYKHLDDKPWIPNDTWREMKNATLKQNKYICCNECNVPQSYLKNYYMSDMYVLQNAYNICIKRHVP